MQYSTAKRERLLPPLVLLEIGLGLIVAFALLRPSAENLLRYEPPATRATPEANIDPLDLAYQRALHGADQTTPEDLRELVVNLLRDNRWDEAQALLDESPQGVLEGPGGTLLELEFNAAGLRHSTQAAERASYEAALLRRLSPLLDPAASVEAGTLQRAAEIARGLNQAQLAGGLFRRLAAADETRSGAWWQACAQAYNSGAHYGSAADCYREALVRTEEPAARLDVGMQLVENLNAAGDRAGTAIALESLIPSAEAGAGTLERIARLSLRAGYPEYAFPLFARLADVDPGGRTHWFNEAATWAAAANQPGLAADYLQKAAATSNSAESAELAERRQQLLNYAGRNEEALQILTQRIEATPGDAALLKEGVKLARSSSQYEQAGRWNAQLLALAPNDREAIALQVELSIAQKQVETARDWAARWVDAQPKDAGAHTKLAQLEEWNGQPGRALVQWQWLAQHKPALETELELVRVAEMNWQPEIAAAALLRSARYRPLDTAATLKLVKLYEAYGNAKGAIAALESFDKLHPNNPIYIRELASLHQRGNRFDAALAAWERFAERYGRSAEETLNRAELHWRLRQPERAVKVVESWQGPLKGDASPYQLKLLAELGWRYRKPTLVQAAVPQMVAALDSSEKLHYGQRMVKAWLDAKEPVRAVEDAVSVWHKTNDPSYLFRAIELSRQHNLPQQTQALLKEADTNPELRKQKDYWMLRADQALAEGQHAAAIEAYRQVLDKDASDEAALDGLLWSLMALGDRPALTAAIKQHRKTVSTNPRLWSTYAMAEVSLDRVQAALPWFEMALAAGEPDYSVLLSYADALEKTGAADRAHRVRTYALKQMRPRALAGLKTPDKLDGVLRDYAALAQRYAGADHNEAWSHRLLQDAGLSDAEKSAREEVAISWLLSTQRFGYAKLLLTEQHQQRVKLPDWQRVMVALHDNDTKALDQLLKDGKGITPGDRVLALEKLGRESEALALAEKTVNEGATPSDREIARNQAVHLKQQRPSHAGVEAERKSLGNLDVEHAGAGLRHTVEGSDFGIAVKYARNRLTSGDYQLKGRNVEDDLAVGLHFGNQKRGAQLTVGTNQRDDAVLNYLLGGYYRQSENGRQEFRADVDYNVVADNGAALRAGAQRDRLQLAFRTLLGQREYAQLTADAHRYETRDGETIAEGFGAALEVGLLGAVGSNTWQVSAIAQTERNDLIAIPASLRELIGPDAGFDSVIADRYTSVALGAGLMRGGIKSDFPRTAAPRYHLRMQLARSWPGNDIGLQLDAGAGVRVLGNDELGFQFVYDQALGILAGDTENQSTVGVHYRNYF